MDTMAGWCVVDRPSVDWLDLIKHPEFFLLAASSFLHFRLLNFHITTDRIRRSLSDPPYKY